LENPAGQGRELLRDPEEFAKFYLSLPDDVRRKVKVCLDTCHAFAAGVNPVEFIRLLESYCIPVGLIHFTDTKVEFGGRRDRHTPIGTGKLGIKILLEVLLWANRNHIACVFE
jgi:deoxyribonuclease-4